MLLCLIHQESGGLGVRGDGMEKIRRDMLVVLIIMECIHQDLISIFTMVMVLLM